MLTAFPALQLTLIYLSHLVDSAAKSNACALDFGEHKKTNMLKRCSLLELFTQLSCESFLKFQDSIFLPDHPVAYMVNLKTERVGGWFLCQKTL